MAGDELERLKALEIEIMETLVQAAEDGIITQEESKIINEKLERFRSHIYGDNVITPDEESAAKRIYDEVMKIVRTQKFE